MTRAQCIAITAALLQIKAEIREWESYNFQEAIEGAEELLELAETREELK